MKQYIDLLKNVLKEGSWQDNRTGIKTKRIDGAMLQFNMADGFPAVTTKRLAFRTVARELYGFVNAFDSADKFRNIGCNIWNQNANETPEWLANPNRSGKDDLGRIYGQQWRFWNSGFGHYDQLARAIELILDNPESRRIIVTAWNPGELGHMALPPCHMMFQFLVDVSTSTLSMCMYQRSCDMFLGIPFNIASYALLLEIVARAAGLKAGRLTMFLADVHIYENHLAQVSEQIGRVPKPLPTLNLVDAMIDGTPLQKVEQFDPDAIELVEYRPHGPLAGLMAI